MIRVSIRRQNQGISRNFLLAGFGKRISEYTKDQNVY